MRAAGPVLIIPAKPLTEAKTRLTASGVPDAAAFAVAFLVDTLTAALATASVAHVLVVTEDDAIRELVEQEGGTAVMPPSDRARTRTGAVGVNAAVAHAAAWADDPLGPGRRVVMVSDLPALRPIDLAAALDEARAIDRPALVTDAVGTGTTLLTAAHSAALRPCFGERSAQRHQALGYRAIRSPVPTLRRDVDVRDDLRAARQLGVGPRTAALIRGLCTPGMQ